MWEKDFWPYFIRMCSCAWCTLYVRACAHAEAQHHAEYTHTDTHYSIKWILKTHERENIQMKNACMRACGRRWPAGGQYRVRSCFFAIFLSSLRTILQRNTNTLNRSVLADEEEEKAEKKNPSTTTTNQCVVDSFFVIKICIQCTIHTSTICVNYALHSNFVHAVFDVVVFARIWQSYNLCMRTLFELNL